MASEKIDALQLDITSNVSTEKVDKLIESLGRLSAALNKIKSKTVTVDVKQTGEAAQTAASSVDKLSSSFLNQAVKITALIAAFRKLGNVVSDGIANSMNYIKSLNMFTISLGEYADNASKYGETVRDALGIDISGWQKAQGVFQTLITGFGVSGDQAAYMSQNLTQLSYDIASFYGLTNEEAQNKLKAAISGRLEPIRKLGYDLSQSKLTDIAKNPANYGKTTYSVNQETGAIEANTVATDENTKHKIVNFNQLTQQEKVQLRYIALMTQVTQVQGDYARALNDPANQMKVFKEQVSMTSRALGNMFIPMLNKVLPYLSAFAQLAEEAFQSLARLFGFELPDMKERIGDKSITQPYNDVVKATGKAAKNAKKIKDYMLGIDELNVLRPDTGTGTGGGASKGQNSNLTNLKTPGYDFLSKAVENSIKKARENIQKFFDDLKKNPFLLNDIFKWGASKLGENFWEGLLGKSPEELAADAAAHGRTVGQEFCVAFTARVGDAGAKIWTLILGKTPEEFGAEANAKGMTVGELFLDGIVNKSPIQSSQSTQDLLNSIFGKPEDLAARATEAGRTVGEQFQLELLRNLLKIFDNPVGKFLYGTLFKKATGKDIDSYLAALDKKINSKVAKKTTTVNSDPYKYVSADLAKTISANLELNVTGNASEQEARKQGEKYAKAYGKGIESEKGNVQAAGNQLFKSGYNGANNNGNAELKYKYVSADAAKAYYSNLASKTNLSSTKAAGGKLASAGVTGAGTENGKNGGYTKAGNNAGAGYVGGINSKSNLKKYKEGGKVIGLTSLIELKKTLGIKSPSREFMKAGDYSAQGYASGIEKNIYLAKDAAADMAQMAVKAVNTSNSIFSAASVPTRTNAGYGVGTANEGAMASLASNIYQAIVSGISSTSLGTANNGDIKVIIDGKEVFKAVQTEQRKRGAVVSNGTFSR